MTLPWFRLYHELKDDPKIGRLTDLQFRVFIESLCWACQNGTDGGTGLSAETANWAFRRDVTVTVTELSQAGLLTVADNGEICVSRWSERQTPSDSSAERTRKYRAKQLVTVTAPSQSRHSDATEESRVEESRADKTRGERAARAQDFPEAEIPSWEEFWTFCQSLQCGLTSEAYAKDKFLAGPGNGWSKTPWRNFALRVKGWWEQDGRPATSNRQNGKPADAESTQIRENIKIKLL